MTQGAPKLTDFSNSSSEKLYLGEQSSNVLDRESHLEGKVHFKNKAVLAGHVRAHVSAEEALVILDSANVEGELHCQTLEISGHFNGAAYVRGEAWLRTGSFFNGTLECKNVKLDSGAKVSADFKVQK
jgi:cytoskeletal protein CcmA (bactofilin family)